MSDDLTDRLEQMAETLLIETLVGPTLAETVDMVALVSLLREAATRIKVQRHEVVGLVEMVGREADDEANLIEAACAATAARCAAEIESLRAEVARLTTELTVANNRLGNAVGAIIDTGNHYCTGPADVADAIYRLTTETEQLRAALKQLERWDMLTLNGEGRGVATGDAPWARKLIAVALAGGLLQDGDPTP